MTTLYIMRHSEPFKVHKGIEDINEDYLITNLSYPLSIDGEKKALNVSLNNEFSNLDVVWSSQYSRAMGTAKYFAANNNLKVNISSKLGERVHGVRVVSEIPSDYERRQFIDENYKIGYGESQKEVKERIYNAVMDLVNQNKDKRVLVVSHATAISFLLLKWCNIELVDDKLRYSYKDKELLHGYFRYCECFKLTFDNNELLNIENVTVE